MTDNANNATNIFGAFRDGIRELFGVGDGGFNDPDLPDRRAVYNHGATFLAEHLGCPKRVALGAVHHLCGEQDSSLLSEGQLPDSALLEQVQAVLLAVRAHYLFLNSTQAERLTLISFLDGDQPVERTVTEVIGWDFLPTDVRSERLRHGVNQLAFQLYPRDDASND